MALSSFLSQEETSGLNNVLYADLAPRNLLRLELSEYLDLLAVYNDGVVGVGDVTGVLTMHGVVTQHVSHVIRSHARVIDAQELDVFVVQTSTENHTADTAKAVDTYFDTHSSNILLIEYKILFYWNDSIIHGKKHFRNDRFV